MRIIIVLSTLELGGAERQALHLARHFHLNDWNVEVWGLTKTGTVSALCDNNGITWRVIDLKWRGGRMTRLSELWRFVKLLRRARPDIILPYSIRPNVVCGAIWRFTGARLCVWNQRDEGRIKGGVGRNMLRCAVSQVPTFISNSQHAREFLCQELGVPIEKVRVIHNGVRMDAPVSTRLEWRRRLGIPDQSFTACMLGNLHSFKDHVTLLEAWKQVVNRMRGSDGDPFLLLAGRYGDTYELLQSMTNNPTLSGSVRFLGRVDDVSGLLNSVDLAVFSSLYEGCPNGVLEPMAMGLPVVATDIPGIREAVGPEYQSWLVAPSDPVAMANAIVRLASSPGLSGKLSDIGRVRINRMFNINRMCEETTTLIHNQIGEVKQRGGLTRTVSDK